MKSHHTQKCTWAKLRHVRQTSKGKAAFLRRGAHRGLRQAWGAPCGLAFGRVRRPLCAIWQSIKADARARSSFRDFSAPLCCFLRIHATDFHFHPMDQPFHPMQSSIQGLFPVKNDSNLYHIASFFSFFRVPTAGHWAETSENKILLIFTHL